MRKNFRTRESGASVLESTVCLLALTLAGFTAFEIAQWHVTRYLARLALHAAAREGAITGANPQAIRRAASIALASRHATTRHHFPHHALNAPGFPQQMAGSGLSPAHIEILSPSSPMFADFADADLSRTQQRPTIRNDFLAEQHAAHHARGWGGGAGPRSGNDIFDANTLRLRLTVLHAIRVPVVAMLVRALPATGDRITDAAHRNGLLAITLEADSAMHSHPMLWAESSLRHDSAPVAGIAQNAASGPTGTQQISSRSETRLRSQDAVPDMLPTQRAASGAVSGNSLFTRPGRRTGFTAISATTPKRTQTANDRPDITPDSAALCGSLLCCPSN